MVPLFSIPFWLRRVPPSFTVSVAPLAMRVWLAIATSVATFTVEPLFTARLLFTSSRESPSPASSVYSVTGSGTSVVSVLVAKVRFSTMISPSITTVLLPRPSNTTDSSSAGTTPPFQFVAELHRLSASSPVPPHTEPWLATTRVTTPVVASRSSFSRYWPSATP